MLSRHLSAEISLAALSDIIIIFVDAELVNLRSPSIRLRESMGCIPGIFILTS